MLHLFPASPSSRVRRSRRALRLACEALEARQLLSSFTVNEFNVDSATTSGSLRWAITQATLTPGNNTVAFDPTVFDVPRTITLTAGMLAVGNESGSVTVAGPGANLLTVNANHASRVFDINSESSVTLTGATITGGSAGSGKGGGVDNYGGTLSLANVTISGNSAYEGGGLSNYDGTTSLTNVTISGNSAFQGGGVANDYGTLSLTNVTVSGNTAANDAGGLNANGGTTTLTNVTLSGNIATNGVGGGIRNDGALSLTNVTLSGNSSGFNGGGLTTTVSTVSLTNVTVTGNSTHGNGGGLDMEDGSSANLINTIVAGNTSGVGVDISGSNTGTNNLIGGDPLLAPLGDYGGPTLTMPPLPGSPAIGAGTSTGAPTTDQRGFARGATVDIGAVQHQTDTTLVVAVTGDAGAPAGEFDLRGAVNVADIQQGSQKITFASTVFSTSQTITLTAGQLVLNNPALTTIIGPGANLLTVSGNHASRVFDITGGSAALSGLTITGGSATFSGGGLYSSSGNLSLTNVTVSGNSALQGGGLFNQGTETLTDVTVSGNFADAGGGLFSNGPSTLINVTVSGNSATEGGGLYISSNTMSLTNVTVSGNSATGGGGLSANGGATTLTNTIVAGNTKGGDVSGRAISSTNSLIGGNPMLAPLGDYGGPTLTMPPLPVSPAIGAGTSTGAPTTDERGFARGATIDIGAVQHQTTTTLVVAVTGDAGAPAGKFDLRGAVNVADIQQGPQTITFASTVFIRPQTITLTGGQLVLDNPALTTITGPGANLLTISSNHASRVFDITGGPAALSGLTITGGSAASGGGMYNSSGNLSLTNVTVSGNSATVGGGLFNHGTATLTDVTISGNSATAGGGLFSNGPSTLTNVTVSGNSSQNGGGIYNYGSTMSLINVTVSGNSANSGGGLMNYLGTTSLFNTIVAGNTAGGDVAGSAVSSTNSLIGGNPLLAPLGFYGGSTETMPLLPGSPAIGGGTATGAPTTDQRGVARTGRVDIGAFQSQGFNIIVTAGNNQSTAVGTAFRNQLSVTVSSSNGEPVAGGVVSFTGPASGASATFTGNPAVIGANGFASVGATASGAPGTYTVTASTGLSSAGFTLTNLAQPAFSDLDAPTITYGTATATLGGTILAGAFVPSGSVNITVNGVTESAAIDANGNFSVAFPTAMLHAASSPYAITYAYAGNGPFLSVSDSSQVLSVNKATPTLVVTGATATYDGTAHPATFTITGVNGDNLTSLVSLTYAGSANVPVNAGTYAVVASFAGDSDYLPVSNSSQSVIIAQATATILVTPYSVTFNAAAHTATGTATGVGGVNLGSDLVLTGTTHTNAGTYSTDSWTFTDPTGNYQSASGIVNDVINEAAATISVTPYSVTYNAAAHTATGSAIGIGGANLGSDLVLTATTHTNAGTYSTDAWTFTDPTGNYQSTSGTVVDVINRATAAISVTPYSVTFNAAAHTATGTATGIGGVNLGGDLVLTGTTHTNAGTYSTDAWTFTDPTGNYQSTSSIVVDVINRATAAISVTPYTVNYDTNAHTATGTATGIGGANLGSDLVLTGTTHTNAGTYSTDAWTFTDPTGNYQSASGIVVDAINQAAATILVTPYSVTYNAAAHTATGTATGIGGVNLGSDLVLTGTTHTNAGTYSGDVWTFTDPTGNYQSTSGTVNDTINQAATTTVLTSSVNPASPGQSVTFTAIVSPVSPGGGNPTGSVTFENGSTVLGTVPISIVGGQAEASLTTTFSTAGSFTITAAYANIDGNDTGSSISFVQTVQTVQTTGVYVSGTTLYVVGANSSDYAAISAAGSKTDGSTGLSVASTLNGVWTSKTFVQPISAIVIVGNGGNDNFQLASSLTLPTTVTEGNGNNYILLSGGNDTVTLGTGSNQVFGGNGNKTITSSDAAGTSGFISLGNGNDVVSLGAGNDQTVLGSGNNTVTAGDGNDSVTTSGSGNNSITLGNGNDYVNTGNGIDTIALGSGNENVQAGNGNKTITAGNGNDYVAAGTGTDVVSLANGNDNVQLGSSNDTIALGDGADYVSAGDGNDNVTVGNGNDNIQLGNGSDVVVEGNGNDYVSAGNGADLVVGGLGQHTIQLGNGNDILIDGSATVVNAGDSLRQILSDWNTSPSASVNTRLKVVYNTIHPNVLKTGSGRDWFFYNAPTTSNKKATDRLN
jgi:RTX calcium-binding nonapeptide repeat (4 copies)